MSISVFLVLIAVAVRLADRGPVFFAQKRVGQDGRLFSCLKFRTMVVDAEERLEEELRTNPEARSEWAVHRKLREDPRIIPFVGKILRKHSLDELPQFINVLLGDMSIVGPRPVTPEELPLYGDKLKYYLAVRPGITGAWQVSGRSELSFDQRVNLDAGYVQNWSFLRDLFIITATVRVVLSGSDAY